MKKIILILASLLIATPLLFSQTKEIKIYNPEADARADIKEAVAMAKAENKHVLLQIGGNWCPWCVRLHGFIEDNPQIDSLITSDYVRVYVNVNKDKSKRNPELMASLGNPQRFGFPVLVILNQEGERIHTQDSWYLEKEKSYSRDKLMHFFKMWNVKAAGK
jgi:uncharacterized protein YyaL (SSP411 family)